MEDKRASLFWMRQMKVRYLRVTTHVLNALPYHLVCRGLSLDLNPSLSRLRTRHGGNFTLCKNLAIARCVTIKTDHDIDFTWWNQMPELRELNIESTHWPADVEQIKMRCPKLSKIRFHFHGLRVSKLVSVSFIQQLILIGHLQLWTWMFRNLSSFLKNNFDEEFSLEIELPHHWRCATHLMIPKGFSEIHPVFVRCEPSEIIELRRVLPQTINIEPYFCRQLPRFIWVEIMYFLSWKQLVRWLRISKRLNSLCDSSVFSPRFASG